MQALRAIQQVTKGTPMQDWHACNLAFSNPITLRASCLFNDVPGTASSNICDWAVLMW